MGGKGLATQSGKIEFVSSSLKRFYASGDVVDEELLARVAREHEKGRMLLIATTNLDALRPVIWDLGRLAARGGPEALALFRAAMLASASIPGVSR